MKHCNKTCPFKKQHYYKLKTRNAIIGNVVLRSIIIRKFLRNTVVVSTW